MSKLKDALRQSGYGGALDDTVAGREAASHDASMFELMPTGVCAPRHAADIGALVNYARTERQAGRVVSLTARSAGTDMSGGAINDSLILNMTAHFNKVLSVSPERAVVQPGVYYRDFEAATLRHGALMPSYPASRDLCTLGGMVANNAGGEKSLRYGKTERYVLSLKIVLYDGKEYVVRPLDRRQLRAKMAQDDFEGRLYRQIHDLLDANRQAIEAERPRVSKDSTAYHAWNVWDARRDQFDLNQLIIGSQGTLGIVTEIELALVPAPKHSGTLVIFLRRVDRLGDLINHVLRHNPVSFEGFDNYTLMLSFKLFYYFHQTLGWGGLVKLGWQLLPDLLMLTRGIPKMVLLAEFNGDTAEEVRAKVHQLRRELAAYGHEALFEEDPTEASSRKFWIMRRESFNLLRKTVHDKHTAPFIDDLVVPPEHLPSFLPELRQIINRHRLLATVAGHMGDGNFHVIPLMKIEDPAERAKLAPVMHEVNQLVLRYGGSLSGEHNDGLSRGPWLNQMYSPTMMKLFRQIKAAFDPDNIFNPHKKTDADWAFSMKHLRQHF